MAIKAIGDSTLNVADVQVCGSDGTLVAVDNIVKDGVALWERPKVRFVAVGESGHVHYSYDGIAWTTVSCGSQGLNDVCFGNNKFVAVGSGGMYYSADGIAWTHCDFGSGDIESCVCYGSKFVAGCYWKTVCSSDDGITWTKAGSSSYYYSHRVCYGNGKFVMVFSGGNLQSSTDAVSWFSNKLGSNVLRGALYDRVFIVVGDDGKVYVSANASKWYTYDPGAGAQYNDVCSGGGYYVAVGFDGEISYSTNSVDWSNASSGISQCLGICYADGKYVVVTQSGEIWYATSPNGTWTRAASGLGGIYRVCARS